MGLKMKLWMLIVAAIILSFISLFIGAIDIKPSDLLDWDSDRNTNFLNESFTEINGNYISWRRDGYCRFNYAKFKSKQICIANNGWYA